MELDLAGDESLLVERARSGNRDALEMLLERYLPRVLRFGVQLCGDRADAEDVLQQTLEHAARGMPHFEARARFSTWLYTIARHECHKLRRRSKFAPERLEPLDEGASGGASLALGAGDDPEARADAREMAQLLRDGIAALEPEQREVLVLRDVEGLSANEVSSIVGISVAAVKSRLHRARAALRETLGPELGRRGERPESCPDILPVFSRYLEGEIGREECDAMQAHVASCPGCSAECAALEAALSVCRREGENEVPADVQESVRRALRRVLGAAGA